MSFFQAVSMAHQERVHSQVFGWIFSEACHAFSQKTKLEMLTRISGINLANEEIIKVHTEYHSIDIIIQTTNYVLAIENKIKTCTHSKQLERYEITLSGLFPKHDIVHLYFSLFNEDVRNSNWAICTHESICKIFEAASKLEHSDKYIFEDYLSYYNKLCWAYREFSSNPSKYSEVFKQGHLSKENKAGEKFERCEVLDFIFQNQLETLFQMAYLAKCAQTLIPHGYTFEPITESHGTALLNIPMGTIDFSGQKIEYGVQYQGKAVKVFVAPYGYKGLKKGNIPPSLLKVFFNEKFFNDPKERQNKDKGKGFNSKTFEFGWPFEINPDREKTFSDVINATEKFFKKFEIHEKAA